MRRWDQLLPFLKAQRGPLTTLLVAPWVSAWLALRFAQDRRAREQRRKLAAAQEAGLPGRNLLLQRPSIQAGGGEPVSEAGGRQEFARGLVVCAEGDDAAATLSWDTTYTEIAARADIAVRLGAFGQRFYEFQVPLCAGALVLHGVTVSPGMPRGAEPRMDVPIEAWTTKVTLALDAARNYELCRAALVALLGLPERGSSEGAHQNTLRWTVSDIEVRCTYRPHAVEVHDSGACSLVFRNWRKYPALLTEAHLQSLRAEEVQVLPLLPEAVGMQTNFRLSRLVRSTPPALRALAEGAWIVWVDPQHEELGFASEDHAIVAKRVDTTGMQLQNVAPAKGPGAAYLDLILNGSARVTVGIGGCGCFDGILQRLQTLTRLTIEVQPLARDA